MLRMFTYYDYEWGLKKRKHFLLVWFDNNILLFREVKKTIVIFDYSGFKALDMNNMKETVICHISLVRLVRSVFLSFLLSFKNEI